MKLPRDQHAFTLIEVMIALAIFFMCMFAILGVFATSLHSAFLLRRDGPTPGMIASELSLSNELDEGLLSGSFGDTYPNYNWTADVINAATNGLYRVNITIKSPRGEVDSTMSILLYRPEANGGISRLGNRAAFMNGRPQ